MKLRIFSILSTVLFFTSCLLISCAGNHEKEDEVLIKDLSRAISIISEKNDQHHQKLKKYYDADTTKIDIRILYQQLSDIKQYKEEYKSSILEKSTDPEQASKVFLEKSFSKLDENEKNIILKKFKDSPIVNTGLIQEMENKTVLPYELSLESEIITEEFYRLILKDFSKGRQDFDWEIFW
jgi:hypothetical protein